MRILPVVTQLTLAKAVRYDRLCSIAIEASEQSERLSAPDVQQPQALSSLLFQWPSDRWLVLCDETASGKASSREILQALPMDAKVAVVVGPEGGWTAEEILAFKGMPMCTSLPLGPRILRADTAAVAALTLVQCFVGDWSK
jgi:16S rRNA (uracil1498-N3)-methyltransferase